MMPDDKYDTQMSFFNHLFTKIYLPYIEQVREERKLAPDSSAAILLDGDIPQVGSGPEGCVLQYFLVIRSRR